MAAENLAPDGGFGWIIVISMVLVFTVTTGPSSSFVIIYDEIFEATGRAISYMALTNSVYVITFSLSGLLTTALLKTFPMRAVGITGALLFSIPTIMSPLVTHAWHLIIISFMRGIGLGLMSNICNANFNAYWVKRRTRAMSAAHVVIGLGSIVYPIIIEKCMRLYGFRGTSALMSGLSLNCIAGMMLMHPVEWHRRDPGKVRMARARLAEESRILRSERLQEKPLAEKFVHPVLAKRRSTIHVAQVFSIPSRWSSLRSLKEGGLREFPLLVETLKVRVASNSDVENGIRLRSASATHRRVVKSMSALSASSIDNIAAVGSTFVEIPSRVVDTNRHVGEAAKDATRNAPVDGTKKSEALAFFAALSDLFELSLFKDRVFITMCLGMSFVLVSDTTFSSLLPLMMIDLGYDTKEAALAITVSATAELVSRILLALFTLFVNARPKMLFFLAMICMAFAEAGFFYCDRTLPGTLVSVAAIGMVRSWLLVTHLLVVVENFPAEKYVATFGFFSLVSGTIMMSFGTIIGFIKDSTNSFTICQLVLIGLTSVFIVPWSFDFMAERKRTRQKTELSKSDLDKKGHSESQPVY